MTKEQKYEVIDEISNLTLIVDRIAAIKERDINNEKLYNSSIEKLVTIINDQVDKLSK